MTRPIEPNQPGRQEAGRRRVRWLGHGVLQTCRGAAPTPLEARMCRLFADARLAAGKDPDGGVEVLWRRNA